MASGANGRAQSPSEQLAFMEMVVTELRLACALLDTSATVVLRRLNCAEEVCDRRACTARDSAGCSPALLSPPA